MTKHRLSRCLTQRDGCEDGFVRAVGHRRRSELGCSATSAPVELGPEPASPTPRDIARPANRRRRSIAATQHRAPYGVRDALPGPGVMEPPMVGSIEQSASKLKENTLESEFNLRLTGWLLAGLVLISAEA